MHKIYILETFSVNFAGLLNQENASMIHSLRKLSAKIMQMRDFSG